MMTMTADTGVAPIDQMRNWLLSAPLGHVIRGANEPIRAAGRIDVLDPSTGKVIAETADGDAGDVDRAVAAARRALVGWRATPPAGRAKTLLAIADRIEAHGPELAALETLNTGKPLLVSRVEIPVMADVFRCLAGAARTMQSPATDEYASGYVSMIRREPVGVIGAITPWNYPLLTAVFKIAGALAVGNTMVLKPSELTPLTTLRFMELVGDILPAGVLNIVLGTGATVGSAISRHPDIDMVSLTGSVASGQRVVSDSARTLKPTHLELGGKAPVVVFADADLDSVAESVRSAGFWNTGQECGAATRIICAEPIRKALTERLIDRISTIKVGGTRDGGDVEMGPLISSKQRESVSSMVAQARSTGARVALGGAPIERDGYFFQPTVITDVARGSEITTREIFGPVVSIESFTDEAEAIELSNAVSYGLSASVWTENVGRALRVSSALDFGTVWVNTHLVLAAEMPWGGYGASGHGRELSTLSLEDFSRTKHVMIAKGGNLSEPSVRPEPLFDPRGTQTFK